MAYKYVAFGQLIEGEETLAIIENIPTYYESPKANIIIMDAGILNLECQKLKQNTTNEYLQSHIEDLVELGKFIINVNIKISNYDICILD